MYCWELLTNEAAPSPLTLLRRMPLVLGVKLDRQEAPFTAVRVLVPLASAVQLAVSNLYQMTGLSTWFVPVW